MNSDTCSNRPIASWNSAHSDLHAVRPCIDTWKALVWAERDALLARAVWRDKLKKCLSSVPRLIRLLGVCELLGPLEYLTIQCTTFAIAQYVFDHIRASASKGVCTRFPKGHRYSISLRPHPRRLSNVVLARPGHCRALEPSTQRMPTQLGLHLVAKYTHLLGRNSELRNARS